MASYSELQDFSDEDASPAPSPTTELYAEYVEAYNNSITPHPGPPTHADVKLRMPRGGKEERKHRRKLSEATLSDPRFNPPSPSVWSRLFLVAGVALLVWLAMSLRLGLLGHKKGTKNTMRYSKNHAPPNPVVTEFPDPTPPAHSVDASIPLKEL